MKMVSGFEIVNIADDYMLVPVGEQMEKFNGTVVLNEVSAFLLEKMKDDVTEEKLVQYVMEEFDVEKERAKEDIEKVLKEMIEIGIVHE